MIVESCKRIRPTIYGSSVAGFRVVALVAVWAIALPGNIRADTAPDKPAVVQIPARDSALRAVLWMRTSAEYEALCRQVYRSAWQHVRSEAVKRVARPKPLAVILDLDQTVLDNTAYSAYLIQSGLKHSRGRWQDWNRRNIDKIGLVPGAKTFIDMMKAANVHVAFVTNRSEEIRDVTARILVNLGLGEKDELLDHDTLRLLLRTDTGSKEARRREVMARYEIVALLGDNLGDFSDDFRSPTVNSIAKRREKVREYNNNWGTKWFVLPNPIYGSWTRIIDWDQPRIYFEEARH
ncbi:MAG: 5'-nucleotidase, lipoprotein e(P4) family [Acidiferrobacterales bacterium]